MNKKGHDTITLIATAAILVGSSYVGISAKQASQIAAGCLAGVSIHPDLDQQEKASMKKPWRMLWWPYGKIIPHRHPLSHAPILGTLGRVFYLGLLLYLLLAFANIKIEIDQQLITNIVIGLAIADTGHFLADIKRRKK